VTPSPEPFEFRTPAGLRLRGVIWGEAGRDLVFTHGNGFTAQCYAPLLAPLVPRVRVHGVNLRGHGGSDVPPEFPDWDGPYDDLVAYLRERCAAPAILAGHSYGATLSLRVAAEHPELVGGLLLLEPLVRGTRQAPWPSLDSGPRRDFIQRAAERRERWASRDEAAAWLRQRGSYASWAAAPFAAFVASGLADRPDGGVALACPPWLEVRIYLTPPDVAVFHWAERIRQPAVFLRGRESIPVDAQGLAELAALIPISVVMTVRGTHTFPMEHPAEAGRALSSALDVVLRAEGGGTVQL
jgi:pimeloyl-ACP methyl ester carboxylesterase